MAYKALGTKFYLYVWNSSTEMYDEYEIKGIREISGVSLGTYSTIDVTTLDSDSDFKTYIVGLADGAEIEITGIWTGSTAQQSLVTNVGKDAQFKLTVGNSPTQLTFQADVLITNFEVTDITVEGVLGFSCTSFHPSKV